MVQRLDHLVSRTETTHPDHGAVDGYGGLTVRGNIDRVLISEWALADELPLEFLRRIAASELLYLSPSYRSDQGRGRIAVLLDTGPDQLGPGRLVQLAGLIVFHRRAEARGTELLIGVLGDEPGAWRTGPFTAQLAGWLSARRNHRAVAGEAEAWSTGLEHPDECWLFSGPEPISPCATRHTIVTRICGWTEAGANAVEVVIDGDRTEFALPRSDEAVRALRGSLLRADPSVAAGAVLRDLHFPSTAPWLLARTATSAELASIRLDPGAVEPARRQRHALPGGGARGVVRRPPTGRPRP
ncbi:MAG: hypothetical protein J0H43_11430 [Actinobacteria bacterium]|nr:hypothetical protein [Actinomycetota bacterium]